MNGEDCVIVWFAVTHSNGHKSPCVRWRTHNTERGAAWWFTFLTMGGVKDQFRDAARGIAASGVEAHIWFISLNSPGFSARMTARGPVRIQRQSRLSDHLLLNIEWPENSFDASRFVQEVEDACLRIVGCLRIKLRRAEGLGLGVDSIRLKVPHSPSVRLFRVEAT